MKRSKTIHNKNLRRGNWLIGCGVVLVIMLALAIAATIFVVRSYRGWIASGIESATDTVLVEMQIEEQEQGQIKAHVQTLMAKYEHKEIDLKQLGDVFEELVQSPLMAAAIVGGVDKLYFTDSDLSDEEQGSARNELRRYAAGLFDKSISPDSVETVLASVSTNTPDNNDIMLQYQTGPSGSTKYALRSADQVSDDDLRELVAQAKAKADEAGVEANPAPIDLSDTLGIAFAQALGDDPDDWVPGANKLLAEQAAAAAAAQIRSKQHTQEELPSDDTPADEAPAQDEPVSDDEP